MAIDLKSLSWSEILDIEKQLREYREANPYGKYMLGLGEDVYNKLKEDYDKKNKPEENCPDKAFNELVSKAYHDISSSLFVICDLTLGNFTLSPQRKNPYSWTIYRAPGAAMIAEDPEAYFKMHEDLVAVIKKYLGLSE